MTHAESTVTATNQPILVIKLGALGDMVQAMPMFDILHQQYGANLTLLTTDPFIEFAQRSKYFNTIICDNRISFKTNFAVLLHLRKQRFHSIVDLQNVDRTRLYRKILWGSYNQWITDSYTQKDTHPYKRFTDLCATQSWPDLPPINIQMMAEPLEALPKKPYMLIVAGASNAHEGRKKWSQKSYATLCQHLLDVDVTPVLIGSKNDNLCELETFCAHTDTVNLIGKTTLFQLITLAQHAVGAVGNDTGPQLIVAASGCPTITLFSLVNPPSKGGAWPWDESRHKNMYADNLSDLSVDTVWNALQPLL